MVQRIASNAASCLMLGLMLGLASWAGAPTLAQDAGKTEWPESNSGATAPATQPEKGPGGTEYNHKSVEVTQRGEGAKTYWLYTPAEPKLEKAPVVMFIHGYGQLTPDNYVGWIHHIVKRGSIVVYPKYQDTPLEPTDAYAPNCAASMIDALAYLESDKKLVQPIREKFAITGHSAGGITTGNVAADWEALKLPKPVAAMPVQPGRAFSYNPRAQSRGMIPCSEFENIPEDCLLLCVFSDSDHTVGAWCAKQIFSCATKVKPENKNLVEVLSSDYGKQAHVATHQTPASQEVAGQDLFDWYAYWKLFDGLTDAAFYGKNREYALGNTEKQRDMGKYSDGRPFEPMVVTLGHVEVDPMAEYIPAFKRNGERNEDAPKRQDVQPETKPEPETPRRKEEEKPAESQPEKKEEKKDEKKDGGREEEF